MKKSRAYLISIINYIENLIGVMNIEGSNMELSILDTSLTLKMTINQGSKVSYRVYDNDETTQNLFKYMSEYLNRIFTEEGNIEDYSMDNFHNTLNLYVKLKVS